MNKQIGSTDLIKMDASLDQNNKIFITMNNLKVKTGVPKVF